MAIPEARKKNPLLSQNATHIFYTMLWPTGDDFGMVLVTVLVLVLVLVMVWFWIGFWLIVFAPPLRTALLLGLFARSSTTLDDRQQSIWNATAEE